MPVYHTANTGGGGGVNLIAMIFGTDVRNPPHSELGGFKKQTHSYSSYIENYTHLYTIFQILRIHIHFGWKRYPIDILLMWKYTWRPEEYTKVPLPAARLYIPL